MRDDSLPKRVKALKRDIEGLRSLQKITGDSLLSYNTASASNYDFSTSISTLSSKVYQLTFTAATAKGNILIDMKTFIRMDNSNVMAAPQPEFSATAPEVSVKTYKVPTIGNTQVWQLKFFNNLNIATRTIYAKFYFTGTDSGTWMVTSM